MQFKIIFIIAIAISLLASCEKDNESGLKNDLSLLQGKWRMTSQTQDGQSLECYSQIYKGINIDNNEILWIDTIKFGSATFDFSEYSENILSNSFILSSDSIRDLYGLWTISGSLYDTIKTYSRINTYMVMDTMINRHQHSFSNFIEFNYKIEKLTDSSLVLVNGGQKLIFEKSK